MMPSRTIMAAVVSLALLTACAKQKESSPATAGRTDDAPPAQTATATPPPAASAAAATPAIGCHDVFGRLKGDKPGSTAAIPADFPPPPPGSTLCGESIFGQVVYLNTSMPDDDLIAYYRNALVAKGFAVDPVDHTSGGNQRIDFALGHTANGYVATTGDKDHLAIKYKDVFRVAYHQLPH
jgi:hypothetical protein